MPYTVSITADEAKLLNEAKVDGVEGGIFTFKPADSMEILEIVGHLADPEALGLRRLKDRLATLYGTWLAAVARKRTSEQASDANVFQDRTAHLPPTKVSASLIGELTGTGYVTPGGFDGPVNDTPAGVPIPMVGSEGFDEVPSPAPQDTPKLAVPGRKRRK